MGEGILEVDEIAGDRVVELRGVGELHGVGLITCEEEVIVQGDEGPVRGVAQESDEEKTLKERCACPWMG